jgi:cytochrome c-type biogenesis protein CcmE
MSKRHQQRLIILGCVAIGLFSATALILYALKQNINLFLTPSQIATASLKTNHHFRLGGMVKNHSVKRNQENLNVQFTVTDTTHDLVVHYTGILPDLFREGKGVVALGYLNAQGIFMANQVLAKHDENYMPKNVAQSIEKAKPILSPHPNLPPVGEGTVNKAG